MLVGGVVLDLASATSVDKEGEEKWEGERSLAEKESKCTNKKETRKRDTDFKILEKNENIPISLNSTPALASLMEEVDSAKLLPQILAPYHVTWIDYISHGVHDFLCFRYEDSQRNKHSALYLLLDIYGLSPYQY